VGDGDGVIDPGDGTAPAPPGCGDGSLDEDEACDDGGREDGDGCSANCLQVESGFICRAEGVACERFAKCGDGVADFPEQCDDGGLVPDDGCSATCPARSRSDGSAKVILAPQQRAVTASGREQSCVTMAMLSHSMVAASIVRSNRPAAQARAARQRAVTASSLEERPAMMETQRTTMAAPVAVKRSRDTPASVNRARCRTELAYCASR